MAVVGFPRNIYARRKAFKYNYFLKMPVCHREPEKSIAKSFKLRNTVIEVHSLKISEDNWGAWFSSVDVSPSELCNGCTESEGHLAMPRIVTRFISRILRYLGLLEILLDVA